MRSRDLSLDTMKPTCQISVLLALLYQAVTILHALPQLTPRSVMVQEKLDSLRHLAIIKASILRRLGIDEEPDETAPVSISSDIPAPVTEHAQKYTLSDVSSYHSELSDNFTDENIIQFRLATSFNKKHIEVNGANLLVRVKVRKGKSKDKKLLRSQKNQHEKRRKRSHLTNEIDVIVSDVTNDGNPGNVIATIKSKMRKTKLIKISLPKDIVQRSLDSDDKILQFFVSCNGCNKKIKLILVHKSSKKNRRRKRKLKPKIHKRRPILIVQSNITSN